MEGAFAYSTLSFLAGKFSWEVPIYENHQTDVVYHALSEQLEGDRNQVNQVPNQEPGSTEIRNTGTETKPGS